MLACVDVDYRGDEAVAACVSFAAWDDATPAGQLVERISGVAPYVPGQFYRRELPCLLAVLGKLPEVPEVVVIDGYVWLADEDRPGLGAHLYEALAGRAPVVGVAKTRFHGARLAVPVVHGAGSTRPLFVTAAGLDLAAAAAHVQAMHGEYRIPTLLRLVDQLCRQS
jgi:deoxyribonuclease V